MRRAAVALSAPIALWMVLAIASCVYAPRQSLRPQDSPLRTSPPSIDGTYCFTTVDLTLREYTGYENSTGRVDFLPTWEMREYSLVHVVTEGQRVSLQYTSRDGVTGRSTIDQPHRWERGKMIVDLHYSNPMGFLRSRASYVLYRLRGGELVAIDTRSDAGLSCGFLPMYHRQEAVVVLAPESACARG